MEGQVLDPKRILHDCGVTEETVIADFGCGPGIFAIPAAEITDKKVYCFDVLPTALEAVASKARTRNITNIATARVNLEGDNGSKLGEHSVDLVIMRKILCQNDDKKALFTEAHRILRAEGKLLVIGWSPEAVVGPSTEKRVSENDVRSLAHEAQFEKPESIIVDSQHYAILFEK